MNKILIIGKTSFIGTSLKKYLKKYFKIDILSFEDIEFKGTSFFYKYSHIINTSIHKNYVKNRYKEIYDLDKRFLKKFKQIKFIYIFLNTRKIYNVNFKIKENSKLNPSNNYAKNKIITEKFLKKKLKKKLLSLRIGNIIGKRIVKNKRNHHKLFFDNFLILRKKNKKVVTNNEFKDFLSIRQFCNIIKTLIQKKVFGIYNVSLSRKIQVSEIIKWLDPNFHKKFVFKNIQKDSFTLSNTKVVKKIKIKPSKKELELFCKNLI